MTATSGNFLFRQIMTGSQKKNLNQMRHDAAEIFKSGVTAVEPGNALKKNLYREKQHLRIGNTSYDLSLYRNIHVIGAGKATAPMAAAMEEFIGDRQPKGVINVKYGHTDNLKYIETIEAGHPLPDENGQSGAQKILNLAQSSTKDDLVICLLSGGGSALLPLPVDGVSLADKQAVIRELLACGATIHEINTLRKHLSRIKGGQLAKAAYPARVLTFILSDVVGDNLDVIASGPTVPDTSTFSDCVNIIEKYAMRNTFPKCVTDHIDKGLKNRIEETPKKGEPFFDNTRHVIIGSNIDALHAARHTARQLGYHTLILSSLIEGDTVETAKIHAAIAKEILKTGNPLPCPACILSGGETTVRVTGKGLGGRNMEFALASAMQIAGYHNIVVLSAGTDGTDGPTDAAGAISDGHTVEKAALLGIGATDSLDHNDSYHFFNAINDLMITGPTKTNVMDIRAVLVA